jgi:hypothetical protein
MGHGAWGMGHNFILAPEFWLLTPEFFFIKLFDSTIV